jgi:hypothetical protein
LGRGGGPGAPPAPRAPKELLHHLPAPLLRRPSVSAYPTWLLSALRGSRLLDLRPPHYRCPAVPGLRSAARAILMAPGSSVLPLAIDHLPNGGMRTAGDANCVSGRSRRHCSAASPVALRASAPGWNPTAEPPGARARSRRLHRGTTHLLRCWVLRTALAGSATASLLVAAPDHCGPPGPEVSSVAVLHQRWLRSSTTEPSCVLHLRVLLPGSSFLPGPAVLLGYERNPSYLTARCLLQPT